MTCLNQDHDDYSCANQDGNDTHVAWYDKEKEALFMDVFTYNDIVYLF